MRVFIPTCESAVCTVPEWHRADLKDHEETITSPEGWSPGALNLAQGIASRLHSQLLHAEMSRLIIDLSKHPDDNNRWSRLSRLLTDEQRQRLDDRQKANYIATLVQRTEDALKRKEEVVHLSVDTRPDLDKAWIAFIYDSRSNSEAGWVKEWTAAIRSRMPEAVIREAGAPTRDLAAHLRTRFPRGFSSVRLVANQSAFLDGKPVRWLDLKKVLTTTVPR